MGDPMIGMRSASVPNIRRHLASNAANDIVVNRDRVLPSDLSNLTTDWIRMCGNQRYGADSKDLARALYRPWQGEMGHFASVGSRNVHVSKSRPQHEADVERTLVAGGGNGHLLDMLLENDCLFEPVGAGDAPDRAASSRAQIGFVLNGRPEIVVVSTVPLLADMILPGQGDDEILFPYDGIAVALEQGVGFGKRPADRGGFVLRETWRHDINRSKAAEQSKLGRRR
jgi:hypothetical protein